MRIKLILSEQRELLAISIAADAVFGGLIAAPFALMTANPLGIAYGALQGGIIGSFNCYASYGDTHTESTIIANTAVTGGLAYVYSQRMIALSIENLADTISSIQQVAAVTSIVALAHNTIRSCTDILMSSVYGVEEEATFYN